MGFKIFLLVIATVLLVISSAVAARDLTETSTTKRNAEAKTESNGVKDPKHPHTIKGSSSLGENDDYGDYPPGTGGYPFPYPPGTGGYPFPYPPGTGGSPYPYPPGTGGSPYPYPPGNGGYPYPGRNGGSPGIGNSPYPNKNVHGRP